MDYTRQLEKLKYRPYREIEAEVVTKRVAWYKQQKFLPAENPSPRQAYELFFFRYLELAREDVPVIRETETEIEWLSLNPCPTLEACRDLGLDTRQVCRSIYEKATQALISQLDPQLRFLRSYKEIRPYSSHCRQKIVRVDFKALILLALEEARLSLAQGYQGSGAITVLGQDILTRVHGPACSEENTGLHPAAKALKETAGILGEANLSGVILVTSDSPCPKCLTLADRFNLTTSLYNLKLEETTQKGKLREAAPLGNMADRSP